MRVTLSFESRCQDTDPVKQEWADRIAKDLVRHALDLRHVYFCFDRVDELSRTVANAGWYLKDKKDDRTFLERSGHKEEEIALWVSQLTPASR